MKLYNLPGCPYCKLVIDKLEEMNLEYKIILKAKGNRVHLKDMAILV